MTPSYAAGSMKSSKNGSSKCQRIVICPWSWVLGHWSLVICPWSFAEQRRFQASGSRACPLAQSSLRPGRVPSAVGGLPVPGLPAVVPACRNEGGFPAPESRFPAICRALAAGSRLIRWGRRLPFWQSPCPSPLVPRFRFPVPRSLFPVPCSRLLPLARVSPGFRRPVPGSPFPAFGSYPQRRMPIRPCCKPLNSGQNRSKRRRFPSKRDQKGAHFVMPILTFWVWTPSGASARAVLGFPKGQKPVFRGSEMPC